MENTKKGYLRQKKKLMRKLKEAGVMNQKVLVGKAIKNQHDYEERDNFIRNLLKQQQIYVSKNFKTPQITQYTT